MKKLKVVAKVTFVGPPEEGISNQEDAKELVDSLLNIYFNEFKDSDRGLITWELTSEEVE